ncbi:LytTR family transcriptional regulator [Alteromonadaceae bacterium M269]|nr:LytTR family transcriptional regulator [Alteromonadaceae bacterium M269]
MAFAQQHPSDSWTIKQWLYAIIPGLTISTYSVLIKNPSLLSKPSFSFVLSLVVTLVWACTCYVLWHTLPYEKQSQRPKHFTIQFMLLGVSSIVFFATTVCAIHYVFYGGNFDSILSNYLRQHAVVLFACYIASAACITIFKLNIAQEKQRQTTPRKIEPNAADSISIRTGNSIKQVKMSSIKWIEALDNYAIIHTSNNNEIVRLSLQRLSEKLNTEQFKRVHRSAILNTHYLAEIKREGSSYIALLNDGTHVPIARRRISELN